MAPLRQRMLEDMQLRGLAERTQESYLSAGGGQDGSPNAVEVIPAGAAEPVLRRGKLARQRLRRGDVLRLITGWAAGTAIAERAAEAVGGDVRNGFLNVGGGGHGVWAGG